MADAAGASGSSSSIWKRMRISRAAKASHQQQSHQDELFNASHAQQYILRSGSTPVVDNTITASASSNATNSTEKAATTTTATPYYVHEQPVDAVPGTHDTIQLIEQPIASTRANIVSAKDGSGHQQTAKPQISQPLDVLDQQTTAVASLAWTNVQSIQNIQNIQAVERNADAIALAVPLSVDIPSHAQSQSQSQSSTTNAAGMTLTGSDASDNGNAVNQSGIATDNTGGDNTGPHYQQTHLTNQHVATDDSSSATNPSTNPSTNRTTNNGTTPLTPTHVHAYSHANAPNLATTSTPHQSALLTHAHAPPSTTTHSTHDPRPIASLSLSSSPPSPTLTTNNDTHDLHALPAIVAELDSSRSNAQSLQVRTPLPAALRSVTSAPLLSTLQPPSRDPHAPVYAHNAQSINTQRGVTLKLTLPDSPYHFSPNQSQLGLLSSSAVSTPVSPTRSPRSAKSTLSNSSLRSPATSPRKRATLAGSRYSPPPVFGYPSSACSDPPPPTPPLPRSPAALGARASAHLSVPSPKSAAASTTTSPVSDETVAASFPQAAPASIAVTHDQVVDHDTSQVITTPYASGLSTFPSMAADASRRTVRNMSATRPNAHGRAFSTDMRQHSSESIARQREQREQDRDRKAMLNKALQKAHRAVVSDNAYNFEGAISEYRDACELLHQVLLRSTADEERKKLDQIRETYSKRINELVEQERENAAAAAQHPAIPLSSQAYSRNDDYMRPSEVRPHTAGAGSTRPHTETLSDTSYTSNEPPKLTLPASSFGLLSAPMNPIYAPPPLSPRRDPPGIPSSSQDKTTSHTSNLQIPAKPVHTTSNSGSASWLGTLSSGTSSQRSSTHSLDQSGLPPRLFTTTITEDTQAEFDAALDAAVEAAYADGFDPSEYSSPNPVGQSNTMFSGPAALKISKTRSPNNGFYIDEGEDEDESRHTDNSKNQALDDFDFGLQKSTFARDSDGSQFSGSTYHSSVASSRTTQSTSLSTVTEGSETTLLSGGKVLGTLPRLSEEISRPDSMAVADVTNGPANNVNSSVRSRRMSGPNTKQLKIETMRSHPMHPPTENVAQGAKALGGEDSATLRPMGTGQMEGIKPTNTVFIRTIPQQPNGAVQQPLPSSAGNRSVLSPADTTFTLSPGTPGLPGGMNSDGQSPKSFRAHGAKPFLRKNKSAMSLKGRTMSMSSPDGSDGSVATPMSQTFSYANLANSTTALTRKTTALSTTQTVSDTAVGQPPAATNLAIFDADIHSPNSPGFPNANMNNAPTPLEPCPEPVLLRPFWLLRCVYQTIAHPRGGYISTRLFVPRDVWRVKGVKLKAVDEKIAHLDTLTHALTRLNMIDTNDMECVLEEMQTLEATLDSVQTALQKKLGHDVGTHGLNSMFRDAPADPANATGGADDPGRSQQGHRTSSKSYLSSWRKLRSKTSSSALSAQNNPSNRGSGPKDGKDEPAPTMATVPMTSMMNIRFAKRDIKTLDVTTSNAGPNAAYMASLARLCDAVQVVDLIARQVEDPGLKGSSSTHVGLELCTRHASEFFGFYICRIVLADVGLLLDKYLKRGTEWVLA